jgi:hypothetical protein
MARDAAAQHFKAEKPAHELNRQNKKRNAEMVIGKNETQG